MPPQISVKLKSILSAARSRLLTVHRDRGVTARYLFGKFPLFVSWRSSRQAKHYLFGCVLLFHNRYRRTGSECRLFGRLPLNFLLSLRDNICWRQQRRALRREARLHHLSLANFISARRAAKSGFDTIHFTYGGMGDTLILLAAAKQYHRQIGKKLLCALNHPHFAVNNDAVEVLTDFGLAAIENLYYANSPKVRDDCLTVGGKKFTLTHVSTLDLRRGADGKNFIAFPHRHIIARTAAELGVSGEIEIAPKIYLSASEKNFGRFSARPQIAIMSGGVAKYKTLPFASTQKIIDTLKDKYDFVQIGSPRDEPLNHALHQQGQLSLRETAAVLANSDLYVGSIGALMHLARAVECPAVIAYSAEPPELCYYTGNSYVFSDTPCAECAENRLDPCREICPHDYRCVKNIDPQKMVAAIVEQLSRPKNFPRQTAMVVAESPCAARGHFAVPSRHAAFAMCKNEDRNLRRYFAMPHLPETMTRK